MLSLIFGLALSLRLLHLWLMRDSPYFSVLMGDSRAYDSWATQLAAGDWLGGEVFYQAPLYPYFLGAVYTLFGRDLIVVRVIQAAIGALTAVLIADAASRVFSRRDGLFAGLLMACYAPAIFLSGIIQKAALDVLLVSTAIWAAARIHRDAGDRRWWMTLGVSLGLLSLTRENALVLIPVALVFARRHSVAPLVLGAALVLTPVAVRNLIVGGGFYLTTSQFGPNLYIGNNSRADGTYQALREGRGDAAFERQDAKELAENAIGRQLSPGEVSAYWRNQAFDYLASHPVDWLRLMARKAHLLVSATELPDTEAQEAHAEESALLRVLQPLGHFGLLLPLALIGVVVSWADRRRLAMLYAFAAAYALSVVIFFVFARYRYPLVPFVVLFAAAGIAGLPAFLRDGSPRRTIATLAAAMALVVIAHRPVLASDVMHAISATNLGVALQAHGRLDEAAAQYRRAIAMRPDYAPAHNNLGVVLRDRGRLEEAIAAYREALRHHPDDPGTHLNLANALRRQGHTGDAVVHLRRAVALDPQNLSRRYDLGNALLELRDVKAAEQEFRQLTALAPDGAQAYSRLGIALAAQSRFDEAIGAFRKALALRPGYPEAERYLKLAIEASGQ